ncbi:MAG: ligase-associated DNA damage response endonuclease PdeM [Cyclobacteriaceae bacterium]|nr:ligase-associated DNA damage response endonuclease PdeM [Cyclobacteriaceae bacterium]
MKEHKFEHLGQNLLLHPYKAIYWIEQQILLLSDIHLGKAAHFRKSGIPIPDSIHTEDYERLLHLIAYYKPRRLIILGDLFHSSYNNSWETVRRFFTDNFDHSPELVLGNHDILDEHQYSFIRIHKKPLVISPFIFSHEPLGPDHQTTLYNLCGHIHPGVMLRAPAHQSLRAQCFYFGESAGILPAFGKFTGMSTTAFSKGRAGKIFLVASDEVIPL